jgi:hypothetical protein
MIYLGKNIPEFIMDSRTLIFGIKDDSFIKERILPYKVDEERIDEMVTIYYEAEKAESEKTKEFGEQLEARKVYDLLFEEADDLFKKYSDFLKLGLKYNVEKLRKLLSVMHPKSRNVSQWIKQMNECYDLVLGDNEVVECVLRFGITKEDIEAGHQKLKDADLARQIYTREKGEAQDATLVRDEAFRKLFDVVEELKLICTYALEDRPQLMEKLGIQVLSPGYKRKKKDEKEVQGEEDQNQDEQGQELEKEKGTDKSEKKVNTGSSDSETICIESKESQEG